MRLNDITTIKSIFKPQKRKLRFKDQFSQQFLNQSKTGLVKFPLFCFVQFGGNSLKIYILSNQEEKHIVLIKK